MAIIKIKSESYNTLYDVSNLISYILNPAKLDNNIYGSRYLYLYDNPLYTAMEIANINNYYGKTQGSIVKHMIVSYPYLEGQCTPQTAEYALKQMLDINLPGFPYIYAFHEDSNSPHFHIVFGTVNLYSGMKYPDKKSLWFNMSETISHYSKFFDSNGREKHIIYNIVYDTEKII